MAFPEAPADHPIYTQGVTIQPVRRKTDKRDNKDEKNHTHSK